MDEIQRIKSTLTERIFDSISNLKCSFSGSDGTIPNFITIPIRVPIPH